MGEVGLRGQAEEKVHDQVDILVDPVQEEVLGIVNLHHHADGEEYVADLHQQCQDSPANKTVPKDACKEGTQGLEGKGDNVSGNPDTMAFLKVVGNIKATRLTAGKSILTGFLLDYSS